MEENLNFEENRIRLAQSDFNNTQLSTSSFLPTNEENISQRKDTQTLNKNELHINKEHFKITMNLLVNIGTRLIKNNQEFLYLLTFLFIWVLLIVCEFIYGFSENIVNIINDSFFNYFKTFSFLIAVFSILLSKINDFDKYFLKNRIELIAALSNCVFLIIVSMYMCVEALHLVTEETVHIEDEKHFHEEELNTILFFKNFYVVKVIIDVIGILVFSDYILHPAMQIKLHLWKKSRIWKDLNNLDVESLKASNFLIKTWNNHFENMNALNINIISDLVSSILFLILFHLSQDQHLEFIYFIVSVVNVLIVFMLTLPVFQSSLKILMQGKSELYNSVGDLLHKEISYFEGCLGIKEIKFWMVAQNEVKCKIIFI